MRAFRESILDGNAGKGGSQLRLLPRRKRSNAHFFLYNGAWGRLVGSRRRS